MKTIGMELKGNRVNLVVLEKDNNHEFHIMNSDYKSLEIEDHTSNDEIKHFTKAIHSYFDTIDPERIGIIQRNPNAKGKYAVSPLSFKVEGLIQLYSGINIEFITSQTLAAYFKKNSFSIKTKYEYQINPTKLAYYLIQNS